jgi:hypothetical protein
MVGPEMRILCRATCPAGAVLSGFLPQAKTQSCHYRDASKTARFFVDFLTALGGCGAVELGCSDSGGDAEFVGDRGDRGGADGEVGLAVGGEMRCDERLVVVCWLLSQPTHKKWRLSMMNPSICAQMAKVASTHGKPICSAPTASGEVDCLQGMVSIESARGERRGIAQAIGHALDRDRVPAGKSKSGNQKITRCNVRRKQEPTWSLVGGIEHPGAGGRLAVGIDVGGTVVGDGETGVAVGRALVFVGAGVAAALSACICV